MCVYLREREERERERGGGGREGGRERERERGRERERERLIISDESKLALAYYTVTGLSEKKEPWSWCSSPGTPDNQAWLGLFSGT